MKFRSLRGVTLALLAVMATVALVGGAGLAGADWNLQHSTAKAETNRAIGGELDLLLTGMLNQETGIRGYVNTADPTFLEPFQLGRGQVATAEHAISGLKASLVLSKQLSETEARANVWEKWADGRRAAVLAAGTPASDDSQLLLGKQLFDAFRSAQAAAGDTSITDQAGADSRAQQAELFVEVFSAAILLLVVLVVLTLAHLLIRRTLRPLEGLAKAAGDLHAGREVQIPELERRDEIGGLAAALEAWRRSGAAKLALARAMADVTSTLDRDQIVDNGLERFSEILQPDEITLGLAGPRGLTPLGGSQVSEEMAVVLKEIASRVLDAAEPESGEHASRPYACLPLVADGRVVGVVTALRAPQRPRFDLEDLELLSVVTPALATALQASGHAEVLRYLHQVATQLGQVSGLDAVLDLTVRAAAHLVEGENASLLLQDPAHGRLDLLAATGPTKFTGHSLDAAEGLSGLVFTRREPMIVNDYGGWSGSVEWAAGIRAAVAVPLVVRDSAIGVLSVHSDGARQFNSDDVARLELLAAQIAPVIEEARAFEALQTAHADLERASTFKSNFLANMSHELRTPLNSIMGFSELLIEDEDAYSQEDRRRFLQTVNQSGRYLLDLINDILDLAKIEAGRMDPNPEPIVLSGALDRVISQLAPLAASKSIRLKANCDHDSIVTDARHLNQILLNLLSNAVKFTDAGGSVAVRSQVCGDRCVIEVSDTGIGIAESDQARIFDEFEQVNSGAQRTHDGTGLGLTLTRRLVELNGGRVSVVSTPGEGSTFTVDLPLRPAQVGDLVDAANSQIAATSLAPGSDLGEAEVAGPAGAPLVLAVEDDADALDLLTRYLVGAGYRVVTAQEAPAAVGLARRYRPAVITLDVILPGIDGWQLLQQLKSDPATSEIPVVVISIVASEATGRALGAADYFVKPVNPKALLECIARQIGAAAQRRRTVLAIDDDPRALSLVESTLGPAGYAVVTSRDGAHGIELARTSVPDLVLLDLMMPGLTGFEVIAALRCDEATSQVPIVVLTGKDLSDQEKAELNAEVAAILGKGQSGAVELLSWLDRLTNIMPEAGSVA